MDCSKYTNDLEGNKFIKEKSTVSNRRFSQGRCLAGMILRRSVIEIKYVKRVRDNIIEKVIHYPLNIDDLNEFLSKVAPNYASPILKRLLQLLSMETQTA